ncbi:hypothetical protein F5Y09DRAFT_316191 [Xylaria sp. FL1042]|nr:hypothetical protein F5Y09DRAFT_316191 [Xylaria sp. FL1042]
MNKVDSGRPKRLQTRDNRRRSRDRPSFSPSPSPSPSPISKSKPKSKRDQKLPRKGWFTVRDIIDEKIENGRILYLIDWDGTDQSGRRYDPTWEPAANVTASAINDWRDKKNEASKVAGAPGKDKDSLSLANDPVQAIEKGCIEQESGEQSVPPEDSLVARGTGAEPVANAEGLKIVVELPRVSNFNPSEFAVIPLSQASQTSSQATLPERMHRSSVAIKDQRVIPDSQEISGTSVSEAYNSYHEPVDISVESQPSGKPPNLPGPLEVSRTSLSSGIPSHQPESRSRFAGISGFFANPNISTNPGLNASSQFQTQLEFDLNTVNPTPATTSHSTTVPASFPQDHIAQTFQGTGSQHSEITNGGSITSNSQAAQIVQPLSSHPDDGTSQSQSDFFVFEEDRTVPETLLRESEAQIDTQESSQALSEIAGNIRISTASEEHSEREPSTTPHPEQSSTRDGSKLSLPHTAPDISQKHKPITSTGMEGTSAAEALRLLREKHFSTSSTTRSTPPAIAPPAVPSPVPLENVPSVPSIPHDPTPHEEAHVEGEKASTADIPPALISPMLLLPSGATQTRTGPSFESTSAHASSNPPLDHTPGGPAPLNPYDTPQAEQPTTLDPSALTLSIENDLDGSPSVPTDDGFPADPVPRSTNSDEYEVQEEYPPSLLPHVPTGPSEYLITLPFQTSIRTQYNDIIRENEALVHQYNSAFQVLPHKTPRKDVVEKLDIMFSRLFDLCDFPPFLDTPMSSDEIAKHVIGTNAKCSFVAELLDNLQNLNSDKKVLILVRPGKLMDLLGHVIQSRSCHYVRSGRDVVSAVDARHPLTVLLSSTTDTEASVPKDVDVVIAYDHTFQHELLSPIDQSAAPIILALVNIASIQHINMRIMEDLQPLERKNVLMLALVKAMRYIEEPDPSESLFSIAEKFARRIQMPDDDDDDFYWEPQSVPIEIFDDLYAASSQLEATQLSGQGLGADQHPGSRKRSYIDGENEESLPKRPKMFQPQVVTSLSRLSDAVRALLGDDFTPSSEKNAVVVSVDKLQALSEKFAELESKLEESRARADSFRQLSDRNQKETNDFTSSINNIQKRYMEALKERGIFEANCKMAEEQAAVLSGSLDSCRTEITTLKSTRAELEKKLAEANDALLHSSNPNLVKLAEMEKNLSTANAQVEDLKKRLIVTQSDADYNKNLYNQASQRAAELASENRGYEKKIEELRRKADYNIVEVNKTQSRNEVRVLAQQISEQKSLVREREAELNRVKEELKVLRSGRRETRQSSVPRSPRPSLGVMSPRNGTRVPSAMGGPSSSRGTSPQPPIAVFDGPVGSGNGVQNTALFNQGPGSSRFAHLRDQRF